MTSSRSNRQRMSRVDRMWLRMDHPTNLMMITGVTFFDEPVERGAVRLILQQRLLAISRFRWKVVATDRGSGHYWEPDENLDLDWHLQEATLPSPGDDAALRQFVNSWISTPLDLERPLWQVHLIQNHNLGSAMLWRLHHCIGDGIALMLAMLSLTDLEREAEGGEGNPLAKLFSGEPPRPAEAKAHLERVLPEAVKLLSLPAETLGSIGRWKKGGASVPALGRLALRPPDNKTPFRGSLGVPKRVAWSDPISMQEIDSVRQGLGGTVNDVVTNAVAGGLRRYLEAHGGLRNRLNIRAIVPVSLRPLEEMSTLGNQFGLVFLSLPVGIGDTRRRLAEIRRRMGKLKRSFEPVVAMQIMAALGASPKKIQDLIVRIFGTKGTAVLTNVPGPRQQLFFAGRAMSSFMFWVPQSARLGMGLSILSYAGEVRIGVATDAGLVPDPEEVIAGMHKEFRAMLRLADEEVQGAS